MDTILFHLPTYNEMVKWCHATHNYSEFAKAVQMDQLDQLDQIDTTLFHLTN